MIEARPDGRALGATGHGPEAVACAGTNLWVAISGTNTVVKLLPSSGIVAATYYLRDDSAPPPHLNLR